MMHKTYTEQEKRLISMVQDKVYEVLEETDNDVELEINFIGVHLYAYFGPMTSDAEFCISDGVYRDFTEEDKKRMLTELDVLMNCSKRKEHHEDDEA